jgi:hypothetical protein
MPRVVEFSRDILEKIVDELQVNREEVYGMLDRVNDDELEERAEYLERLLEKLDDVLNPAAPAARVANNNNNNNNNNNANSVVSFQRARNVASIEDPTNVYPRPLEGNVRRRKNRKTRRR